MPRQPTDLKSNRGERTILTYRKLEFAGDWEYFGDEFAFRPVGKTAELLVVTEGATGVLETHWFVVHRRPDPGPSSFLTTDGVFAPPTENIVYIPERCVKKEGGDYTKCSR